MIGLALTVDSENGFLRRPQMIRFGDARNNVCFLATRKEPVIALAVAARSLHVRGTSFAITSTYTVTNPFCGIGSVTKSRRFCYATPRGRESNNRLTNAHNRAAM